MKIKQLLITIVFTVLSLNLYAGFTQKVEVTVDLVNRNASGDMLTARNSHSKFTMIGCGIRTITISPTETLSWGFCQANSGDAEDGSFTCFTQNTNLLESIKAISDYSYISFGWDVDDECTRIGNSTQSFYLPKLKKKK